MNSAAIVQKHWNYWNVLHARGGPAPGLRVGEASELRLCERWTSSAKSVFHFDVRGSVAKSTHAGIPWLKRLRDEAGSLAATLVGGGGGVPLDLSKPLSDGRPDGGRAGRLCRRLLAVLMGLQAGLPPLDFSSLEGRGNARYVAGIHAAVGRDYTPLRETFLRVIARTWKRAASSIRRAPPR